MIRVIQIKVNELNIICSSLCFARTTVLYSVSKVHKLHMVLVVPDDDDALSQIFLCRTETIVLVWI